VLVREGRRFVFQQVKSNNYFKYYANNSKGAIPMRNDQNAEKEDFVPKNEIARIAVERARRIVKKNNETVLKLKEDSNIQSKEMDTFSEVANFSHEDSYAFDLYKIKSSNGITDFFKDIFGAF
jgi:hypothetical protein